MLNKRPKTRVLLAITGAIASGIVSAASVQLSPTNPGLSIAGNTPASITFTGDAFVTNVSGRINYDTLLFDATVNAGGTATCTNFDATGRITFVTGSLSGLPIPSQTFCNVTFTHTGAAAVSSPYTFSNMVFAGTGAVDTFPGGNLVVTAGPAVGPAINYAPAPNAAPATITFAAATSIGGTTTQSITTTVGAGGSNGGTNILSGCAAAGGVTFTDGADTCTFGGACVDGGLDLQCAATNAAQTGTATCTETRQNQPGPDVVTSRSWGFTCPAANVAPALAYNPAVGSPVNAPLVGQGQTANMTIAVTPSAGSGTSTSTVSACAFSAVVGATFTAPAGTLTFTGSSTTPQNLAFSCVAPTNGQPDGTATLTCTQTIGGVGSSVAWPVVCQDGSPVAAPGVTYSPAAGPLVFAQGASLGSPTTQPVTVDINGGASDGAGAPETTSVTCATSSTGFSVGSTGGPFSANAPATVGVDGTVTVTCSAAATQQLGTMSCTATPSVNGTAGAPTVTDFSLDCPAAAVNVSSNPAEGAIALFGAPASQIPSSITLTNTGSASTLACTATPEVTLGAVPATIPAGGSAVVPFTCLAGSAGSANQGTIQCTTQSAAPNDVLDYTVTCTGASNAPIPAVNDLGKVLMAALVIGLGLLGLGARRQMI